MNTSKNSEICMSVPVLCCIVFLYLTSMIKIVNNTNKDQLMFYLRQTMEHQTRAKVLAH